MKSYHKILTLLLFIFSTYSFAKDKDCFKVITSPITTNPFISTFERYQDKSYDFDASLKDSIGGILRAYVLRYDSINSFHVVVYSDNKYDSYLGYWVGISKDNGHTWQRYYTGLGDSRPYYIKYQPMVPLIKNDSIIEIEVAEVKQISQEVLPSHPAEFGLTKDNLLLQININRLKTDSDQDGLTDIEEDKLLTNPFSNDTDKDGVVDALDKNPRYKNQNNKYATLYAYMINSINYVSMDSNIISFNEPEITIKSNIPFPNQTYIIVSDDAHIQHVCKTSYSLIILNTLEWNLYDNKHLSTPGQLYVSSLKRKKGTHNQYTVTIDKHGYGVTFQVTEKKGYWIVRVIEAWQA